MKKQVNKNENIINEKMINNIKNEINLKFDEIKKENDNKYIEFEKKI